MPTSLGLGEIEGRLGRLGTVPRPIVNLTQFIHSNDDQSVFSDTPAIPPSQDELSAYGQIEHWDRQIESLKRMLHNAEESRAVAQEWAFELRAPRAPIHRVPDDILLHIFKLGSSHSLTTNGRSPGSSSPYFQLLISEVCQRWRTLSRSLSSIWSRFTLRDPRDLDSAILQRWLQLANTSSLEVTLKYDRFGDREIWEDMPPPDPRVKQFFAEIAPRLKRLTLWGDEDTCSDAIAGIAGRAASLEELDLEAHQGLRPNRSIRFGPLEAPTLSAASFSGFHAPLQSLQLSSIQHLSISFPTRSPHTLTCSRDLFALLEACGELQSLRLDDHYFHDAPSSGDRCGVFPKLERIQVLYDYGSRVLCWLAKSITPKLYHITFGGRKRDHLRYRFNPDTENTDWPLFQYDLEADKRAFFATHADVQSLRLLSYNGPSGDIKQTLSLLTEGSLPSVLHFRWELFEDCFDSLRWAREVRDWKVYRQSAMREIAQARSKSRTSLVTLTVDPPLRNLDCEGLNYIPQIFSNDFVEGSEGESHGLTEFPDSFAAGT